MPEPADIYHTGFVVQSLEPAMAELSEVFELTWTDIVETQIPMVCSDGPRTVQMRIVYSRGPSPNIELLEPVPDTIWQTPATPGFGAASAHHIGVWCDDFVQVSTRLSERGFERVVTADDGSGGPAKFAYHRLPSGTLIELIDARRRPELEAWFRDGGEYPGTAGIS